MLKMQTERAQHAKRIEDLEEQRSDLERRLHASNSSARQADLDKTLEAQAAAFEAEKQEAVRRTMDACAERGKLEMLNAQVSQAPEAFLVQDHADLYMASERDEAAAECPHREGREIAQGPDRARAGERQVRSPDPPVSRVFLDSHSLLL